MVIIAGIRNSSQSTDSMITHLLHRRENTSDVVSYPHLMNNLHVNKKDAFEKLHFKSLASIQMGALHH